MRLRLTPAREDIDEQQRCVIHSDGSCDDVHRLLCVGQQEGDVKDGTFLGHGELQVVL